MRTVEWHNGAVRMIDQKQIPWALSQVDLFTVEAVANAISDMTVRGAPAIGAAAGFGLALAAQESSATETSDMLNDLQIASVLLKSARPTAVNLAWAVDRLMSTLLNTKLETVEQMRAFLLVEAQQIADEDIEINRRMGAYGASLIDDDFTILHHCNTGALATVDYGTALGVVRAAFEQKKNIHVLLDETRPRLQGSRLSAWELERLGVDYHIIPDTASGYYMQQRQVDIVLVGADRVAANGDFANKIGTYQVAVLAKENDIPFYTVAPTSTIDMSLSMGADIPIEQRDPSEVLTPYGNALVPEHFKAYNPAFDVTPHRYLSGIITEKGIIRPPFVDNLHIILSKDNA